MISWCRPTRRRISVLWKNWKSACDTMRMSGIPRWSSSCWMLTIAILVLQRVWLVQYLHDDLKRDSLRIVKIRAYNPTLALQSTIEPGRFRWSSVTSFCSSLHEWVPRFRRETYHEVFDFYTLRWINSSACKLQIVRPHSLVASATPRKKGCLLTAWR